MAIDYTKPLRDVFHLIRPSMEPVIAIASQVCEKFDELWSKMEPSIVLTIKQTRNRINSSCESLDPTLIILCTTVSLAVLLWLYKLIFQEESLKERVKKWFFKTLKRLPIIGPAIQKELDKTLNSLKQSMVDQMKNKPFICQLPMRGKSTREILGIADDYEGLITINPQEGRVSGAVYTADDKQLVNLISQMYARHSYSNPLHMDIFTDVRKMESEVVRMVLSMFHGGPETCGALSSGGTESILLACKAYRNLAYERGIKHPEMIIATSAHAAFDKASSCFKIKIVRVPVDGKTFAVRPRDVRAKINSNTCMIVVSAPSFPHGIVEPVEEIAALGLKYKVPVHVDCCLGGFLLPFMDKAGFDDIPPFDFRVPGVTSISCDTHKYGHAPKGSSIIMYSESKYRNFQFDVIPDWTGGIYATPTFAGSRCGANATCCWATMMYIGEQGYIERARSIIETARYIKQELSSMEHLYIFGDPKVSVIALGSLDFNIFRLYDALTTRGWHLNALQFPSSFHICVTQPMTETDAGEQFVKDVGECIREIMNNPTAKCGGMGALYGMAQTIPDRRMVNEICNTFLSACYSTDNHAVNGHNGFRGNGDL